MNVIVQIGTSLVAVFVGAAVTYFVNVRERRRRHVEDLFSAAITAVASANAASQFVNVVPPDAGLNEEDSLSLALELRASGYRRFVDLLAEARSAIAAVVPFREDLAEFLPPINAVLDQQDEIIRRLKAGPTTPRR